MKTITEYILESLILEKRSLTSRAQKWAQNIIKIVKEDDAKFKASDDERKMLENISNGKKDNIDKFYNDNSNIFKFTISIKEQHYDLFFIINCYGKDEINSKLNTFDFFESEDSKLVYYIVLNCKDNINDIENQKNTLAHELRHFYDKIKGHGGTKNDTYDKDTINKYNQFLYYISQTEQNAFYVGFKQKLTENETFQNQLLTLFKVYNKEGKTIEEVIKQFCKDSYDYRLNNCFRNSDDMSDENLNLEQLSKPKEAETLNKAKCYNPLRFLEYNYYILDTFDNFKTFILENPKKPGKEDNARKEEILKFLKPYNDDKEIDPENEVQLKKVYDGIKKIYKGTFKSYMNIIKNFIKKHME